MGGDIAFISNLKTYPQPPRLSKLYTFRLNNLFFGARICLLLSTRLPLISCLWPFPQLAEDHHAIAILAKLRRSVYKLHSQLYRYLANVGCSVGNAFFLIFFLW